MASAVTAAAAPPTPIRYKTYYASDGAASGVPAEVLESCASLFSSHYGVWSRLEEHRERLRAFKGQPGAPVKMSAARLRSLMLFDSTCGVVVAESDGSPVGHAFFATFMTGDGKAIRWITQLVVHADFRRRGIAIGLITTASPDRRNLFALGLVSSHPAAVRALEGAAGSRCSADVNARYAATVMAAHSVPYLKGAQLHLTSNPDACTVNTDFLVDHAGLLPILAAEVESGKLNPSRPWQLGAHLPEGHEFFALAVMKPPPSLPQPEAIKQT
jgi:GNAT superfamily N-acetyltransferase